MADDTEFSVEIDPRGMTADKIDALASAGVTGASIGVQDFNERVQAAINRRQSLNETRKVMRGLRSAGISRINIDLIYGLPWQTTDNHMPAGHQVQSLIALEEESTCVGQLLLMFKRKYAGRGEQDGFNQQHVDLSFGREAAGCGLALWCHQIGH